MPRDRRVALAEASWIRIFLSYQLLRVNGRGKPYEQYLMQLRRLTPDFMSTLMLRLENKGWKNASEGDVRRAVLEKGD